MFLGFTEFIYALEALIIQQIKIFLKIYLEVWKKLIYLCRGLVTSFLCVINLLRSGERIGSQTHWQPTRSHALAGLENRCQLLLWWKTEKNKLKTITWHTQHPTTKASFLIKRPSLLASFPTKALPVLSWWWLVCVAAAAHAKLIFSFSILPEKHKPGTPGTSCTFFCAMPPVNSHYRNH